MAERRAALPEPSVDPTEGVPIGPAFEDAAIVRRFLDQTEEEIRVRLAKLRLFDRIFLLHRDWMTRITMLMLILSVFWGAAGGFDILGFQTQVVAYSSGSVLHLSNQEIYSSVTLHGIRELFGFAQQLEMAVFGLLALNALGITPRYKWTLYASVALVNVSMLLLEGPVYFAPFNDNYFPAIGWYFLSPLGVAGHSAYVVSPLWFLGWLALAGGVLLWGAWLAQHLLTWRRTAVGATWRRFPAFMWFVVGALVLVPLTYGPLVVSTVWDVGTAYGGWPIDSLADQVIFWMFGHAVVYLLFLLPIASLYFLLPILARRPLYSYRFAVASAILFVLLTPFLGIHHLYLAPLPAWSIWLTMAISFAIVLPSAITVFSVWMTVKGVPATEWEWNATALFALLSFGGVIFGGLSGPALATVPWDLDVHNSLFVLGHFHAITILAIVAGAFAIVYAIFPILTGRLWFSAWLARLHFVTTIVGGLLIVVTFDELGDLGVLRREVILPQLPAIALDQGLLLAGIVILLVGQLLFVLNGLLTVFRGRLYSAAGLSFDEAIRRACQSTATAPQRVPVDDRPYVRTVPRAQRERAEQLWVGSVVVLLVLVLAAVTPATLTVATDDDQGGGPFPTGTEFVVLTGLQYYWAANETGAVQGAFDNAIVAYAGSWIDLNLTAHGATQSFDLPFRTSAPVNVQVVPGVTSYALFQAPSTPGVYGAPDGEYDGPWFGQDVSALIVLPTNATGTSLAGFQQDDGAGDVYDPPVHRAGNADIIANGEGAFNFSVPGPTLTAPAGVVSFNWTVPLASIGIDNYLVNVTSLDPDAQERYVQDHGDSLPDPFEIARIDPTSGVEVVSESNLSVGPTVSEVLALSTGVYLYGLVHPVEYSYDPAGESGAGTGDQSGGVMGLWGVLWVSG